MTDISTDRDIQQLGPVDLVSLIEVCLAADLPLYIEGEPGVGKSSIVAQACKGPTMTALAEKHDGVVQFVDFRASMRDPVDLLGCPNLDGVTTRWLPPHELPRDGCGIFFFDELSAANPAMQNACLQPILDRRIGSYQFPPDWRMVAAGNTAAHGAHVSRMSSALRSRFTNVELVANLDQWTRHALSNGFNPDVVSFLRFRPELLQACNRNSTTFPCLRTWEMVSKTITAAAGKASQTVEFAAIAGTVGTGAAIELTAYLKVCRSLPSIEGILMAPETADVPTDPAVRYALCSALSRKASPDNFARITKYVARYRDAQGQPTPEFSVMTVRDAISMTPELQVTPAFAMWASDNAAVIL